MTSHDPCEHPSDDVLEDFVLGDLHTCRRILVEAHLAFCPACRHAVGQLSRPASSFLDTVPAEPPPDELWHRLLARLDEDVAPATDVFTETPLPPGAAGELPPRAQPLEWTPQGDGAVALIGGDPKEGLGLFLVKTPPDLRFPEHVHLGGEELVILAGGLTDDYGHMGLGDFRSYPAGSVHAPLMDSGETCWAVALIRGGIDFR